jgi:O-antigen/teichoic acid export membrane protein
MIYAVALLLNSAANLAFGVLLSALLGPAEFGRYATATLAANTLAAAAFGWLRISSLRFSGQTEGRLGIAATLDVGYLGMFGLICLATAAAAACGVNFGVSLAALALTPFLAVAFARSDYAAALFRARDQEVAFAAQCALRQFLCFTAVVAVAYVARDSTLTIAALTIATLAAVVAFGRPLRTRDARLRHASLERLVEFFFYAKPIVISLVIYQLIALINRQAALDRLGAAAAGQLSLATDLGQRLFFAINAAPELVLFQYALQRMRADGVAAGERQLGVNLVLTVALLAPLAAGYAAMAPTFEGLLVPSAYRGEYARLSVELTPGLLAFCVTSSTLNPIFQLAKRTWPVIVAALGAIATDMALLRFADASRSTDALASAYSISIVAGLAIAGGFALVSSNARPRWRDIAAIAAATVVMALAVRPFNALHSRPLAAAAAILAGAALYGALLLLFDVAGLRGRLAAAWAAGAKGGVGRWSAILGATLDDSEPPRQPGIQPSAGRLASTSTGAPRAAARDAASPKVVIFGSARPVTCAVMDYARRLCEAINAQRPGFAAIETIEPGRPLAFVGAIARVLRGGAVAHFQLPIEGWGNSVLPGSALMAARLVARQGRVALTMHEWTSLNSLRYLSTIPDLLAADGFVLVSPRQREGFLRTPWVSHAKKDAAPVIPIGPNIMSTRIDDARVAEERVKARGEGASRADVVVGFFGVLYGGKRPDLLLRVTAALRDCGVKARLLVCGDFLWDKPNDRPAFDDLARQLGVAEWLDFRGRIDDQSELLATLSASDVFLLPYSDGVSVRRGSFQAVSQLAIPLVTTTPDQADEFDLVPALREKIESPATALVPIDASPDEYAAAILRVLKEKDRAIAVALDDVWREAARRHLAFYDRLIDRSAAPRDDAPRRAPWLDAAE